MTDHPVQARSLLSFLFGLIILLTALGISAIATNDLQASLLPKRTKTVEMAIEHTEPLELSLQISALRGKAIAMISHDASETVALSVPESWKRQEVRGVPLTSVTSRAPELGFVRWQLPAGSAVTYLIPDAPGNLLLHNPSGVTLSVNVTDVDLATETVFRDVILVKDSPARLL